MNTRRFIIVANDTGIGHIQVYDLRDYPVEGEIVYLEIFGNKRTTNFLSNLLKSLGHC
tara:strand:+ start:534 stop:707 length:174 start_codon:yes stop_codon:yes gene_type:complete